MQQASTRLGSPPDERQMLIDTTREWGYFLNDPALTERFRGKRVLDIGMGGGPHAIAFVESGAAAYIGVDPIAGSDGCATFEASRIRPFQPIMLFRSRSGISRICTRM